jgi:hypothetical protein
VFFNNHARDAPEDLFPRNNRGAPQIGQFAAANEALLKRRFGLVDGCKKKKNSRTDQGCVPVRTGRDTHRRLAPAWTVPQALALLQQIWTVNFLKSWMLVKVTVV